VKQKFSITDSQTSNVEWDFICCSGIYLIVGSLWLAIAMISCE